MEEPADAVPPLSMDEARRILHQAQLGALDETDPDIRRIIGEATWTAHVARVSPGSHRTNPGPRHNIRAWIGWLATILAVGTGITLSLLAQAR